MTAWGRGWCVCKRAALCLEKGSILGMSLSTKDNALKNNAVLFLASRFSSGANCMQRRRQDVKGVRNLQESHFGEDVKSMTNFAVFKVKRAHKRWQREMDHHLQPQQFADMLTQFRRSLRHRRWHHLTSEMQEAIVAVATGNADVDVLMPHFMAFMSEHFPELSIIDRLREVSDLSSPAQWFPAARRLHRKFIFHAGPTNSGKTHEALQSFYSASSGIYCAPLRMLAAEIYQQCNAERVPCDLLTGEERVLAGEFEAAHLSCTIEMTSTRGGKIYDVGIVDEIQMIADEERGSAWSRVVLGLPAREIHLCGNEAALNIIRRILSTTGDELEVKKYTRLSPLVPSKDSLGGRYRNIQKGDCIIAFSRKRIFQLKRAVESATGMLCAVIYGGLPSATRLEQAKLFNDPSSKYDVLVASDAIGMGLNLNIKRMVFSTLEKKMQRSIQPLTSTQVKQIGGRAGRYRSQFPIGEVSTLNRGDYRWMRKLLKVPEKDIMQAGLSPSFEQIEMFSKELPNVCLDEILGLFHQLASVDGLYFLCDIDKKRAIAQELKDLGLSLFDAYTFCLAPIDSRELMHKKAIRTFAQLYADNVSISVDVLRDLMAWPLECRPETGEQLKTFEVYHEMIDVYLWLGMRYPTHFPDEAEARQLQVTIAAMIGDTLHLVSRGRTRRRRKQFPHAWTEAPSDSDVNWSDSGDNRSDSDSRLNTNMNYTRSTHSHRPKRKRNFQLRRQLQVSRPLRKLDIRRSKRSTKTPMF